jgi:hypothetical protein
MWCQQQNLIGGQMQTILKTLLVGVVLALGTSAVVADSQAADPAIGTWKLNLAKSKFSPGPAPKSQIRTYVESAQGVMLTIKNTAADGKETTLTLTFKDDGKPQAVTGSPDFDMVAVTRTGASTTHSTQTKAGVVVSTAERSVSQDGKTLTFAQKGTHADGVAFDDLSVYDRQ